MVKRSFVKYLKKLNICERIFFLLLIVITSILINNILFKNNITENFEKITEFITKNGTEIYDDFYGNIYDDLVLDAGKNEYEVRELTHILKPYTL